MTHSKPLCHKCNSIATIKDKDKFWCGGCLINDHRKYNTDFRRWEVEKCGKKSKQV